MTRVGMFMANEYVLDPASSRCRAITFPKLETTSTVKRSKEQGPADIGQTTPFRARVMTANKKDKY